MININCFSIFIVVTSAQVLPLTVLYNVCVHCVPDNPIVFVIFVVAVEIVSEAAVSVDVGFIHLK